MSSATLVKPKTIPTAGMSEIIFLEKDEQAKAVVGSCIGLAMYHKRTGLGALAHIVLPAANGRSGVPGKFADTAIPHILETLRVKGCNPSGLVAKMCGGANMFGSKGPIQIGLDNANAVIDSLHNFHIAIQGKSVGGSKGRRITFTCATGDMIVEIAGEAPITL
jgi:chemotaxis protein CheD